MSNKIIGAGGGGGGGGGRTPVEAPNTLRVKTTARVQFLTSQGEVGGLADQTNRLKSVYLNNTPVQNADGSFNFNDVVVEERYGLPSQEVMNGFPQAINTFNIGQKITTTAPQSYTTTNANVDSIRITVRFPALFAQASNGDTNGTSVQFQIYTRLGAGTWNLYADKTVTGKSTSPADLDYLISRPAGTGVWSVQLRRITGDSSSTTIANDIFFQRAAEIQNVQESYNNRAYIGLTVSAETTGQSYPTVSFDLKGIKVKVPSNYDVATRAYTGVWDGTFASTRQVCDNPAWVLYDILTNAEYGLGTIISESDIDKFSFYDAAVYNDELVPNAAGTDVEPRYTFNYQFMEQMDAWQLIQNVAASFGSVVYTSGNLVKVVQDRPTGFSRLITNSNVIDGVFEYQSSQKSTRYTACIVYWNNPAENWMSVPAYYEDATAIARYGLNVKEVTALGITTEGQALRLAKWNVETSISNVDSVIFKVGLSNAGLEPGEVIKVADSDYAMVMNEAKLVSATSGAITVDKPISTVNGNTFDILSSDGSTILTRTITTTGTGTAISYSGVDISSLVAAGADVVFTGAVSPRLFKITNVKEDGVGQYTVSGLQYDPNKFGRVDNTPVGLTPLYQALPQMTVVKPVTNITFTEESSVDADGTAHRYLVVSWDFDPNDYVYAFTVFWNKDNGDVVQLPDVNQPFTRFEINADGEYYVTIYAKNSRGVKSLPATDSVSISLSAPLNTSLCDPVEDLYVKGTTGTLFEGTACTVTWVDPNVGLPSAIVVDYEVKIKDAVTPSTVYRTEYVSTPEYTYDLIKQQIDNGVDVKRSFIVSVRVRDTWGRLSNETAATFSNPAPAVLSGIVVTPSIKSNNLSWSASTDPDVAGYLAWRDTTSTFTPSLSNLLVDGLVSAYTDGGLGDSSTYYYKFAAYDAFGKSYDGTGLNVSASYSVTTLSGATTNEYQLTGITWTPNSPGLNQLAWTACTAIKTTGSGAGSTWSVSSGSATWTSGILYVYYVEGASALATTTNLATAIGDTKVIVATYRGGTNLEYGDGNAFIDGSYVIAGTVGASQLVTGSAVITQGAQIANAIITGAKIDNLTVDTINLKNGAISDTRFVVSENSTPLISTSSTGIFNISPTLVSELIVTTPNPSGLTGPFSTYIHASLLTNVRINGDIMLHATSSGIGTSISQNVSINGAPAWYIQVVNSSNTVIAQTSTFFNASGIQTGDIMLHATSSGSNTTLSQIVSISASGGLNLMFLAPSLAKNTQYKIRIYVTGQLTVTKNTNSLPISLTADQRAIYYQCILR